MRIALRSDGVSGTLVVLSSVTMTGGIVEHKESHTIKIEAFVNYNLFARISDNHLILEAEGNSKQMCVDKLNKAVEGLKKDLEKIS